MFSLLNILQLPVHLVYISMINRLAFNYEINPKILSDGMLWFTDLSSPDPTGILPVAGGIVMLLNILTTSTTNSSSFTRKIRRYFYIFPIISVPVWMTFPVVSLLAIVSAVCLLGVQFVLVDDVERAVRPAKLIQIRPIPSHYWHPRVLAWL